MIATCICLVESVVESSKCYCDTSLHYIQQLLLQSAWYIILSTNKLSVLRVVVVGEGASSSAATPTTSERETLRFFRGWRKQLLIGGRGQGCAVGVFWSHGMQSWCLGDGGFGKYPIQFLYNNAVFFQRKGGGEGDREMLAAGRRLLLGILFNDFLLPFFVYPVLLQQTDSSINTYPIHSSPSQTGYTYYIRCASFLWKLRVRRLSILIITTACCFLLLSKCLRFLCLCMQDSPIHPSPRGSRCTVRFYPGW